MFQSYLELLKKIFESIYSNQTVTFIEYLQALGYTFAIIGVIFAILAIVFSFYKIPNYFWKKIEQNYNNRFKDIDINSLSEFDEISIVYNKYKVIKIIYILGIIFIYIPLLIPTILFLLSSIINLF